MKKNELDWREFFRNGNGKESADRLLLILSFLPATIIAASICTAESLGVYLTAYGALAANNKWVDRKNALADNTELLETSSNSTSTSERVVSRESNSKKKVRE